MEVSERMKATAVQAARKRAAVETYARHEATLRRTARRYSLCADDAEEALQRGLEILLLKAPTSEPRQLIKWMQKVVKHEALAVRNERERVLAGPAALAPEPGAEDWIALLPSSSDGPQERLERREAIGRSREALQALKPQELRALTLLAAGYSYAEIGAINDWTQTKVNRCIAEGRERFRRLLASAEDGSRCETIRPRLSAFCDGEASPQEVAELREHLRACASCRATLRAYRAAPAAAAALAPVLPLHPSIADRIQDAVGSISSRLGDRAEAVAQLAGGGGASGAGVTGLAKLAAVCLATAGAAGACVATGIVPAPLAAEAPHQAAPREERRLVDMPQPQPTPAPVATPAPDPKPAPNPEPEAEPAPAPEPEAPTEGEPVATEPAPVSAEPVEAPAPAPEPTPPPAPSGGGNPAGEFGP
jgi:RNA polymerase sigma factor (sigma-70 family)